MPTVLTAKCGFCLASRQLLNCDRYIADASNAARAEKFIGGIVADCESLAIFPERGTRRDDIRLHLRIKPYRRRVTIAFSVDAASMTVVIYGIFYGGQNFEALLSFFDESDS